MEDPQPILTGHKGFRIAGRSARTSGTAEAGLSEAKIPDLWDAFWSNGGPAAIPQTMDDAVSVALYTEYESDHLGKYTVLVGAPIRSPLGQYADFEVLDVPDASFLLFTARGNMPVALVETWQQIWAYFDGDSPYERTYSADFEIHHQDEPDRVDVYVAVR